ncbi:Conserved_hypothetical protein [Hexamita inflata]|uniref:Myb-like domain-containing protein n=1 Tax=Hexamita inflata TaxID=28002 RepID=A0AA86S4D3_9EUKA|nr:Conserved hypothetical protein [Hexamita inflata]
MQTTHTKTFAPKTKWSDEEVKIFFALLPQMGADFKQYMPHLNRTYSQIKGFYHNHKRRHRMNNETDLLKNKEHSISNLSQKPQSNQEANIQRSQISQETAQLLDSLMDIMFNRQQ